MLDVRDAGGASISFEAADTAKPKRMRECLSRETHPWEVIRKRPSLISIQRRLW